MSGHPAPRYVELRRSDFQAEVDGRAVDLYTLRNRHGMVARLTNYGARIEQVLVPDRDGRLGDVVQGYETLDRVLSGQPSMGAFIGRYANRIADARFSLDGVEYVLEANDVSTDPASPRRNTLHGGPRGSRFAVFAAHQDSPRSVVMDLRFGDREDGFPGTLALRVRYAVTDAGELVIEYAATALDRRTVVNLTGHAFFNLSGDLGSTILDTLLTIPSGEVLELTPAGVPTGRLRPVAGTPLDFRTAKAIGADIGADDDLLRHANGYDVHYVLDPAATGAERLHARAHDPRSGRILEVWSTEPGLQFYSGNYLDGRAPRDLGKGGTSYGLRSAFCLEPSHFPDSVNHPGFPTTVLDPGATYRGEIRYRFRTDREG